MQQLTFSARVIRAVLAVLVVLGGLAVGPFSAPTATAAVGDIGFVDQSFTGVTNPPTSDKPQSKLWFNDGLWWAVMFDPASTDWHIFRLDRATEHWVDTGTPVDGRVTTLPDALWDGQKLYVASQVVSITTTAAPKASAAGQPARLYRFSYLPATKTYALDTGFPAAINNNSSETLTIDKDSTGRLWATWTQVSGSSTTGFTNTVYVNSTVGSDNVWGTPMVLPVAGANPDVDDISAVVAFGGNRIGVMWSNQLDGTVYWAVHPDGAPTTTWTGGVAVRGTKLADDHVNIKTLQADQAGRGVAAGKTRLDQAGAAKTSALINLLTFKPGTGAWSSATFGTIADCHTRPIVMLDEENAQVHMFATGPTASGCAFSGAPGTIYEKVASLDNPVFPPGRGTPVIRDIASANMNNATSTKQSVNSKTGLVVLASNNTTKTYWHADLPIAGAPVPAPRASFTASPTSGVAPLDVTFTDASTGATSWSWDFGDGTTTSTEQNPTHTFSSAETYTVKLTASNAGGTSQATSTITVKPAPVPAPTASFTASPTSGVAPLDVTFTNNSTTSTGTQTTWAWDFGDGTTTSTEQNPTHTFSSAGKYTVTLTASNAGGTSTATSTITVSAAPVPAPAASFTASPTSGVAPLLVKFTDASTGATSWSWDFGDGTTTSTDPNPTHTFASAGKYTVTLTASNAGGTSQATSTITVSAPPSPGIVRQTQAIKVDTTADNHLTINKPAGTSSGDLLVSCFSLDGSTVKSAPSGRTQIAAVTSVSRPRVYGYYRVAGASEPASYRWVTSNKMANSGGIVRYTGASGLDVSAAKASGSSGRTGTVPGVTTITKDAMVVGCMGVNSSSTPVQITGPAGMSEVWNLTGSPNESADARQATPGPTGTRSWTFSDSRDWAGWVTALRPQ